MRVSTQQRAPRVAWTNELFRRDCETEKDRQEVRCLPTTLELSARTQTSARLDVMRHPIRSRVLGKATNRSLTDHVTNTLRRLN